MKTGMIFLMILIVYASAIPIHYSSSEQELTRFEREIKGSDELTETPETDVDRRKREADEHKEHEGERDQGHEAHHQIDVRDKRRIKQPTGPATTTAITTAEQHHQTLTDEKRSAEHERQENHEMKGGPAEHETEDHHVEKRSDSSNEEEITNHSIGDCEERIDAETDSQNISEPTIEETQTQEDPLPPEESLLEIEPGRGLEAFV